MTAATRLVGSATPLTASESVLICSGVNAV
jgi:hypothetical protein